MRLGVFSDILYRSDGEVLSTHQAFVRFVSGLPPRVDELILFGRITQNPDRAHYVLPSDRIRFVELPHYPRVTDVWGQVRALRGTLRTYRRELDALDAVWIFGPHPIATALALTTWRRRKPLFLGVRQDYPQYIAGRLPSRRWLWAVGAAYVLDRLFRLLGRRAPTVAVGDELAEHYSAGGAPVLSTGFSLVLADDVVTSAAARPWEDEWRILSVGRLDPEKNPLLLVEILRRLRDRDPRWRMTIAGDGSLADAVEQRARALGVRDAVDLVGYVRQGDELNALYRRHHVFLHVSLTEGFPQVIFEAQAAAMPVVATAVGGVTAAVQRTQSALLIPPDDAGAAAEALHALAADPALRDRLIGSGLENVRAETMEAQLDRIAAFFSAWLEDSPRRRRAART